MYSFMNTQIKKSYKKQTLIENYQKILIAIQPVIPHFSNECLELINNKNNTWPDFDENLIKENEINIVVQINGRKRGLIRTKLNSAEKEIMELIKNDEKIMKYLQSNKIKKNIYIENKLINIII